MNIPSVSTASAPAPRSIHPSTWTSTVRRDGKKYTPATLKRARIDGKLEEEPADRKKTGTDIRWRPDLEVFTDIDIPLDYYTATLKRQAVVNAGVTFRLRNEISQGKFEHHGFPI